MTIKINYARKVVLFKRFNKVKVELNPLSVGIRLEFGFKVFQIKIFSSSWYIPVS